MSEPENLSTLVPGLTIRHSPFHFNGFKVPHEQPFLCDIEIGEDQLSRAIPHVSNIEYVKWLDRAAELHADSLGFTRRVMLDRGLMWFVGRHEIDYLAEVWPKDKLVLATWVRDMTRVKSWRDFLILRPDDSPRGATEVCRASTLWILVDLEKRKPVRISDDMTQKFKPLHPPRGTGSPSAAST